LWIRRRRFASPEPTPIASARLFRREADIAIRPSKFQQLDVFQRAIAVIQFGLYASDDYLARMGAPDFTTKGDFLIDAFAHLRSVLDPSG
jgi:hypothetical protein